MKKQKKKIVSLLLQGKTLTTYGAAVKRITTKLPTRIGEIERTLNVKFKREKSKDNNVATHYVYSIGKANKKILTNYLK